MANRPAAVHPDMPEEFIQQQRANAAARGVRLLNNTGVLLIAAAGSVIIQATSLPSDPSIVDASAYALVAFFLLLLDLTLVMLALVADQFTEAARVGEPIATALQDYLFAGSNRV